MIGFFGQWLVLLLLVVFGGSSALAQLRTLSSGNAEAQWRDAQLRIFDEQLAKPDTPPELKRELEAQRAWLGQWDPKRSTPGKGSEDPAKEGESKPTDDKQQLRKEPVLDPFKLAAKHRQSLFASKNGPTAEDTKALQAALAENSGDLGLRQLQMHWIDQPRYRNEYWKEIGEACGRVISLLEDTSAKDEQKLAAAFAYYRRSRSMCHALAAAVNKDTAVAGAAELDRDQLQAFADSVGQAADAVRSLVGNAQPEFYQLDIYQLRRDGWHGQALQVLERFKGLIEPSAYLAEKLALQESLGWTGPAAQTKEMLEAIPAADRRTLEVRYIEVR